MKSGKAEMICSDEELMIKCSKGDRKAFDILFQRYQNRLLNFIYRVVGDEHLAEDLFQETLIRVIKAAPSYKPLARFSTWLYQIALNVCKDELRKKKRRWMIDNPAPESGHWEAISSHPVSLEQEVEEREQLGVLRRAIDSLSLEHRMVLVMREYEGLSYEEIASLLDIPVGTVKSRMHYALQRVRNYVVRRERLLREKVIKRGL